MRQEVIVPMHYHELGEVPPEWIRLYMQVAEHKIATPSTDQLDDIAAQWNLRRGGNDQRRHWIRIPGLVHIT